MKQCLNCGNAFDSPYCGQCGQKGSTHRLSIRHFLEHDLVHGIWHVDKGLLFTMQQLFTRPGRFVHDYVAGKRTKAFNAVTLLVICIGLLLYLSDWSGQMAESIQELRTEHASPRVIAVFHFLDHYFKWIILSLIPVFSWCSFLIFRRQKYFYTEHLVINSYLFAGFLILAILLSALIKLPFLKVLDENDWDALAFLYLPIAHWHTWKPFYTIGGWLWRFVVVLLFYAFVTVVLSFIIIVVTMKFAGK